MQEHIDEKVQANGDFFPFFQEEDMPETIPPAQLIHYLVEVLKRSTGDTDKVLKPFQKKNAC